MMLHTLFYAIGMLIPLSIWQPCHCGNGTDDSPQESIKDEYIRLNDVKMAHRTHPLEERTPPKIPRTDKNTVDASVQTDEPRDIMTSGLGYTPEPIQVELRAPLEVTPPRPIAKRCTCKHVEKSQSSFEALSPPRITIDIAGSSSEICEFVHYHYEQNYIRLALPSKNVNVGKVASDGIVLTELTPDEQLEYVKAYLNSDGKPELVVVMFTEDGNLRNRSYARKKEEWESKNYNYIAMIQDLKFNVSDTVNCIINLSNAPDNENCTTFDTDILGLYTRYFFPKSGYLALGVKYNEHVLWRADERKDEKCASCTIYIHGETCLLFIRINTGEMVHYKWFNKVDGYWEEIERQLFFKMKEEITKNRAELRAKWATRMAT